MKRLKRLESIVRAELTENEAARKSDNQIYDEAGNLDIDVLSRETQTPYLTVDYETMRIVGHEGRHRMAALAKAGIKRVAVAIRFTEDSFGFWNAQDQRVRMDGFAKGITEESELRAAAVDEQARIAELLTETDKEYIAILEKGYQEAGRLKAERDIQRLGFTNATEDYYYPIRRGNIAKNVDSAEMQAELDRISNVSFNKDTVRGAKQELYIESADVVFNRHVRGVVQYAYISPAIETYNKLYKGYTAKRAKRILLQYILKLNGTQAEKAALAEKCGFTVRNGRIIRDF